jgi:hypothetical protein
LIAEAATTHRAVNTADVVSLGNGARRATTVVGFRPGESSAAFTGTLGAGEHERDVVRASRNELLEVRIDRVRGRDIVARVFDAATRIAIDARAQEGTRVWTGRIPASADDLIDVARAAPPGEAVLTYWLTIGLR